MNVSRDVDREGPPRSLQRFRRPLVSERSIAEVLRQPRYDFSKLSGSLGALADLAYVREVEAEATVEDEAVPSILGDWIAFLSQDRRRRLFLISVAALTEVLAYSSAMADQELPIHLDKLIVFLLALCEGLGIYLFEDFDEDPGDAEPEDEAQAS